ncbi:MAG: diaminopropionate ammonia-lyase [Acidiferrobacterales bacterium]
MEYAIYAIKVEYVANRYQRRAGAARCDTTAFSVAAAQSVRSFHRSFKDYYPTPLVALQRLADSLGITRLWVKDESRRFGLDAFKVLGASHAVGRFMGRQLGLELEQVSFDFLRLPQTRARLGERVFVTASDGNHGRAVAWAARQLGQQAVVFLPQNVSAARVAHIRELGAEARVTDGNYDESVRVAAQAAAQNGWVLLQDTAWEGYEQVPLWVMQGYLTMFAEAIEQLEPERPTHVLIQAGVGSLGSSLRAYLHELYGNAGPYFAVVEPKNAACFYQSAKTGDSAPNAVTGALETIMAGLAAGQPSMLAWRILRDYSDGFFACSDGVAAKGMQLLGRPLPGDAAVVSGESGAVTTGVVACLCYDAALSGLREKIRLNAQSKVLLFSTEGATDPNMYRKIVSG